MSRGLSLGGRSGAAAGSGASWRTGDTPAMRIAVLLLALAILYVRMPGLFLHPQLWGEDNDFLYKSLAGGWPSIVTVIAGWLAVVQFLVAILAAYLGPAPAPAIYTYAAFLLALAVVWTVTSPRLDMPYKPLLGIAVVIVPMGWEELGTLTNIQWILPVAAFALLFMRAPRSVWALAAEAFLAALVAFSGAFGLFLAPLFLCRLVLERSAAERRRLALLGGIMCIGAVTQAVVLILHPSVLNLVEPTPYSWTVWVNLPFTQFMTVFGRDVSGLFHGTSGAALGLALLLGAALLTWLPPYRTQKLFMLFFALAIAVAGMFKFRAALETQFASQRYFYVGSVFALWFICCITDRRIISTALAVLVAMVEVALVPVVANTPRFAEDQQWPVWASYLSSGLPIIIPTTPKGFYLSLPATPNGPLARFAPWLGAAIPDLEARLSPAACRGAMAPVDPIDMIYLQPVRRDKPMWAARGTVWNESADPPVELVALVGADNRVVGFGLPGFEVSSDGPSARPKSEWRSVFYSDPGTSIRAYGIVGDGSKLCPLANPRSIPPDYQSLGTEAFVAGAEIAPGKDVVQRFKPAGRLEALSVKLVTWGHKPSSYPVDWRIIATKGDSRTVLGSGRIDPTKAVDWQRLELPLPYVTDKIPDSVEVVFHTDAAAVPTAPLGVPMYRPSDAAIPPAEIGGAAQPAGAVVGLRAAYGR